MTMNRELERVLSACANTRLSIADLELLELEAIEIIMRPNDPQRDRAKRVLSATAEIRKARGIWDAHEMSERDIDDEIAMLRGRS